LAANRCIDVVVVASASNYVAAIKGIGDAITARIILYLKINDQS
jgi:hypothetical protein